MKYLKKLNFLKYIFNNIVLFIILGPLAMFYLLWLHGVFNGGPNLFFEKTLEHSKCFLLSSIPLIITILLRLYINHIKSLKIENIIKIIMARHNFFGVIFCIINYLFVDFDIKTENCQLVSFIFNSFNIII